MVQLNNSYARICKSFEDDSTQICACDFRINIYRCDQNEFFIIAIKNQPMLMPPTKERGLLRFRPLHSHQLNNLVYSLALTINGASLLFELYPNVLWAEIVGIMPYVLIASMCGILSLGLVYATPPVEDDKEGATKKLIPNKFINILKMKPNPQLVFDYINVAEVFDEDKDSSEGGQRFSLEIDPSTSIS
ncbi:18425_t:CDS:2 [Funneliformis geosporum]|nr:18425_t:CDS:2 [Funneliformis geosporum]